MATTETIILASTTLSLTVVGILVLLPPIVDVLSDVYKNLLVTLFSVPLISLLISAALGAYGLDGPCRFLFAVGASGTGVLLVVTLALALRVRAKHVPKVFPKKRMTRGLKPNVGISSSNTNEPRKDK